MPQIFHSSTNTLARASIVLAAIAPLGLMMAVSAMSRTYFVRVNVPVQQPVPFSHEHHSNELGIACQYCHVSVEKAANAGIPPTETCMSCHSQIWTNSPLLEPVRESYRTQTPIKWTKVYDLPDFVYFNHSIHVNKGIPCQHCHGNINQQQITFKAVHHSMAWCLECHRAPEKYIRPRDQVYSFDYNLHAAIERYADEHAKATGQKLKEIPRNQIEFGQLLVRDANINKKQLSDCWVCHR